MRCERCGAELRRMKTVRIEILRMDEGINERRVGWRVRLTCPNCLVMTTHLGASVPVLLSGRGKTDETLLESAEQNALAAAERFLRGIKPTN